MVETQMINDLLKYPLISSMVSMEHIEIILNCLQSVETIAGDVCELGCNCGTTSLFIKRYLNAANSQKRLHCYDSFQGLPDPSKADECGSARYSKGTCSASQAQFEKNFMQAGLELPDIHAGWFINASYPERISFSFFDGDLFQSIKDSFAMVWPHLSTGGIIVIHDYQHPQLPGVALATRDYLGKEADLVQGGMGIIFK
jgi:O-methyltransferase